MSKAVFALTFQRGNYRIRGLCSEEFSGEGKEKCRDDEGMTMSSRCRRCRGVEVEVEVEVKLATQNKINKLSRLLACYGDNHTERSPKSRLEGLSVGQTRTAGIRIVRLSTQYPRHDNRPVVNPPGKSRR